jgi:hypothetical protein
MVTHANSHYKHKEMLILKVSYPNGLDPTLAGRHQKAL